MNDKFWWFFENVGCKLLSRTFSNFIVIFFRTCFRQGKGFSLGAWILIWSLDSGIFVDPAGIFQLDRQVDRWVMEFLTREYKTSWILLIKNLPYFGFQSYFSPLNFNRFCQKIIILLSESNQILLKNLFYSHSLLKLASI